MPKIQWKADGKGIESVFDVIYAGIHLLEVVPIGPQKLAFGDCLSKTQVSAKAISRNIGTDACPVPEGYEEVLIPTKVGTKH